jgi:hypothetical protein
MNLDTPTIASSAYASSVHNLNNDVKFANLVVGANGGALRANQAFGAQFQQTPSDRAINSIISNLKQEMDDMAAVRRLVKVIIVDPNENVSLTDCVLYNGEEKMTDATDQELFFEIDIKNVLDTYNAKRVLLIDKKVKERTEYLEPAKVRDLKMVVVNIASF